MNETTDSEVLTTYWQQKIDDWKNSKLSQAKFCLANDLSYHRFVYWRRKFEGVKHRQQAKREGGGFASVAVRPEPDSGLTLSLPNGLIVRGINADNLTVVHQLLNQL